MEFPDTYFEDEVREGFYIPSLMKRAWAAQMEVLEIVKEICEKHKIRFFAEWGTLLGIVRHGGRIPWDDDIDICMLREDYDKFREVAEKELPAECMFLDFHNSPDFDSMLGRVINSRVHVLEGELLEKYHGFPYVAGIDIFWLDDLPADAAKEEYLYEEVQAIFRLIGGMSQDENCKRILQAEEIEYHVEKLEKLCQVQLDRNKPIKGQLFALLDEKTKAVMSENDARDITNLYIWRDRRSYRLPKWCYKEGVLLPFENTEIMVPKEYEEILARKYGENWRVPIRTGSLHDYPSYAKQQKFLEEEQAAELFEYRYSQKEVEEVMASRTTKDTLKNRVKNFLPLFQTAHEDICRFVKKGEPALALQMLGECQETAIQIGTQIEQEQGENHPVVRKWEQYCEMIFRMYTKISEEKYENKEDIAAEMEKELSCFIHELSYQIESEIKERREVVFVPYKPSLWGSMERKWQEEVQKEDTDVFVVPAPYYYKDAYGKAKVEEPNYETVGYPDYVPITFYEDYNFEQRHPDAIVIQCPYDEYNYGMTIHPFFYAKNLAKYTDCLVYIPGFVIDEIGPGDERARETLKSYCNMPGVVYADTVIVQSPQLREVYVDVLTEFGGKDTWQTWENKIISSNVS